MTMEASNSLQGFCENKLYGMEENGSRKLIVEEIGKIVDSSNQDSTNISVRVHGTYKIGKTCCILNAIKDVYSPSRIFFLSAKNQATDIKKIIWQLSEEGQAEGSLNKQLMEQREIIRQDDPIERNIQILSNCIQQIKCAITKPIVIICQSEPNSVAILLNLLSVLECVVFVESRLLPPPLTLPFIYDPDRTMTESRAVSSNVQSLHLLPLHVSEALTMVRKEANLAVDQICNDDIVNELVQDIGCHPLILIQACIGIKEIRRRRNDNEFKRMIKDAITETYPSLEHHFKEILACIEEEKNTALSTELRQLALTQQELPNKELFFERGILYKDEQGNIKLPTFIKNILQKPQSEIEIKKLLRSDRFTYAEIANNLVPNLGYTVEKLAGPNPTKDELANKLVEQANADGKLQQLCDEIRERKPHLILQCNHL